MKPEPHQQQSVFLTQTSQLLDAGTPPQATEPPASQHWHCLSVSVPHEAVEAVANFLIELGSSGVVEGEQDSSTPEAPTTTVQGFFPVSVPGRALQQALVRYVRDLATIFPGVGYPVPRLTQVSNANWHQGWREHFPPVEVGRLFLILPPWEPIPPQTARHVLVIDPSMAFGTGHHATTQSCLESIENVCTTDGPPRSALDLGTGSGILAIALAKHGTQTVWATDVDSIALDEARKNIERNGVVPFIQLSNAPLGALPAPWPLIVANLFSSTLIALEPTLRTAVEGNGYAILSGIQNDQEDEVRQAFRQPHWQLVDRLARGEWVTFVLHHR